MKTSDVRIDVKLNKAVWSKVFVTYVSRENALDRCSHARDGWKDARAPADL